MNPALFELYDTRLKQLWEEGWLPSFIARAWRRIVVRQFLGSTSFALEGHWTDEV